MHTGPSDPLPRAGPGVVLRRLRADDLAAFQAYRRDPGLGRFQGWTPMSDEEAAQFLAAMSCAPLFRPSQWTQIGIAAPADRPLIGDIGLHLAADRSQVEVGFTLARTAQGRGLATEAVRLAVALAFEFTAADRVVGITDSRNLASVRLLERLGMRRVETVETVFRGEPCIELVYALPRSAAPGRA